MAGHGQYDLYSAICSCTISITFNICIHSAPLNEIALENIDSGAQLNKKVDIIIHQPFCTSVAMYVGRTYSEHPSLSGIHC